MTAIQGVRIIAWEDPPPVGSGRTSVQTTEYDEVVTALRNRPNTWAKIVEGPKTDTHRLHQLTTRINAAKIVAFRADSDGEFYAVSRSDPVTGITSVYAIWGRDVRPDNPQSALYKAS
jgi:hypothetical protein